MIDLMKSLFGTAADETTSAESSSHDVAVALCVLLLEAAYADGDCSADERQQMEKILAETYQIDHARIKTLMAEAAAQRRESIDLFSFTRALNQQLAKEEKLTIMQAVWRVILTDGRLEAHEDQLAHKLGNLLRLTHKELIDTKIKARQDTGA
jgi:uncharacterized tellurite resistance protein B-like protein